MLVPLLYNNSLPADHWREIPAAAPPALSAVPWPPFTHPPFGKPWPLCLYTNVFSHTFIVRLSLIWCPTGHQREATQTLCQ